MPNTHTALYAHIVFSTKNRARTISRSIRSRLHAYLGGIARNLGATALAVGGVEDHVHLLLRYPSRLPVADLVCKIKANSTNWVHETFPERAGFSWQTGYAAFSVSRSKTDAVIRYIENQEAHHGKFTFDDELQTMIARSVAE
jgi:putative transposase